MIYSILLILILGQVSKKAAKMMYVPALLLLIILGMTIGPFGLNWIHPSIQMLSSEIRGFALIIILLRAGFGLDRQNLAQVGRPAFLLSFVPGVFEAGTVMILSMYFLNFSFIQGGMLGFILAAVSPAVVVPMMVYLEKKIGIQKKIPTLILAGASVDDIVAISIFSVFLGFASTGWISPLQIILRLPMMIVIGFISGVMIGRVLSAYGKNSKITVFLMLLLAFCLQKSEKYLPISSLLGIMVSAATLRERNQSLAVFLSNAMDSLWVVAEIFLFVLVGAQVDFKAAQSSGIIGFVIIVCALWVRMVGVFVSLINTDLTLKERIFVAISYIPKATVQAAIGGTPLALGLPNGEVILAISVLAILITTPLGAIGMNLTAKPLLE
ncbi:cation:proton antiporter [Erysipelothrix rhusiopathiae]|nr:cation:proton antiporter [Erysipelothrix rhusiopathiae]MDE8077688.1 cation:proton antiporter [Erysipelothrix rhusiopathiae]MDE8082785.1 cation:proton antiporter [Erysipelothrix rhusiopathiae]MDE8093322.1 cation:proton antiporter [Erysipelothrix rhusiopathiae]MDE8161879.1 cation:proton antiporter [Erysipelothrix rhusiopathiae]